MGYMNITKMDDKDDSYRIEYVVDHTPRDIIVNEATARLLEDAKKAGASERSREIRKLLELSW